MNLQYSIEEQRGILPDGQIVDYTVIVGAGEKGGRPVGRGMMKLKGHNLPAERISNAVCKLREWLEAKQ